MRILVLGDIHGRDRWKSIVEKEIDNVDKILFLGDLVTTHGDITNQQQVDNFLEIKEFYESHPDKVIMIFGNHDCQMMGYHWASCSGWSRNLFDRLEKVKFDDWMYDHAKVAYLVDGILFSHAGVTKTWMENARKSLDDILTMKPDITLAFSEGLCISGSIGYADPTGDNIWQSPIWVRPVSLLRDRIDSYIQVVGHTPVKRIVNVVDAARQQGQDFGSVPLWLCDDGLQQYLVIDTENRIFEVKDYEETMRVDKEVQ